MNIRKNEWSVEISDISIKICHVESGFSFSFMKISDPPFIDESPFIYHENDGATIPDYICEEAMEIARELAIE